MKASQCITQITSWTWSLTLKKPITITDYQWSSFLYISMLCRKSSMQNWWNLSHFFLSTFNNASLFWIHKRHISVGTETMWLTSVGCALLFAESMKLCWMYSSLVNELVCSLDLNLGQPVSTWLSPYWAYFSLQSPSSVLSLKGIQWQSWWEGWARQTRRKGKLSDLPSWFPNTSSKQVFALDHLSMNFHHDFFVLMTILYLNLDDFISRVRMEQQVLLAPLAMWWVEVSG